MKVGDLVKMDFESSETWSDGDVWGTGIIVIAEENGAKDVEVLWAGGILSWEMKIMLDKIDESG